MSTAAPRPMCLASQTEPNTRDSTTPNSDIEITMPTAKTRDQVEQRGQRRRKPAGDRVSEGRHHRQCAQT